MDANFCEDELFVHCTSLCCFCLLRLTKFDLQYLKSDDKLIVKTQIICKFVLYSVVFAMQSKRIDWFDFQQKIIYQKLSDTFMIIVI